MTSSSHWKPTVIGEVPGATQENFPTPPSRIQVISPTRMPDVTVLPPIEVNSQAVQTMAKPVAGAPTSMPGKAFRPLQFNLSELQQEDPGVTGLVLEQAGKQLSLLTEDSFAMTQAMQFGAETQGEVAQYVSYRLALMESAELRALPHHLARLQMLLRSLLDAMSSHGLFKKDAPTLWDKSLPEIRQINQLLQAGTPSLVRLLHDLERASIQGTELISRLDAACISASFLFKKFSEQAHLLEGRRNSLLSSKAILLETLGMLALDIEQIASHIGQIRDGILVQLPCIENLMSRYRQTRNETDRYQLTDRLTELLQIF